LSEANKQDGKGLGGTRCSTLRFFSVCEKTQRGFQIIRFADGNDEACELQQSSAIDDTERGLNQPGSSFLWLGREDTDRIHLHREHVQELIQVLQGWLSDGKLDA